MIHTLTTEDVRGLRHAFKKDRFASFTLRQRFIGRTGEDCTAHLVWRENDYRGIRVERSDTFAWAPISIEDHRVRRNGRILHADVTFRFGAMEMMAPKLKVGDRMTTSLRVDDDKDYAEVQVHRRRTTTTDTLVYAGVVNVTRPNGLYQWGN